MNESDYSTKTSAKEPGTHHRKHHRTSIGKTTPTRLSHRRTRASHHSADKSHKGRTFMKKATSSTALALLIGTVVFFTAAETKAAQTYAIDVIDTGRCTSTETYAGTETYGTET